MTRAAIRTRARVRAWRTPCHRHGQRSGCSSEQCGLSEFDLLLDFPLRPLAAAAVGKNLKLIRAVCSMSRQTTPAPSSVLSLVPGVCVSLYIYPPQRTSNDGGGKRLLSVHSLRTNEDSQEHEEFDSSVKAEDPLTAPGTVREEDVMTERGLFPSLGRPRRTEYSSLHTVGSGTSGQRLRRSCPGVHLRRS